MVQPTQPSMRFTTVIPKLELWRAQMVDALKQGDRAALQTKLELDDAIQSLQFCRAHAITASAKVLQLPPTRTRTPSSEYRILEDHETENRDVWTELSIDAKDVRPSPGTLMVDTGSWPDDPGAS